ncbi:MAG: hypothetical protein H7138_13070 [Myxococcales bacterium]|nr:hypothetical protein [Myxococcales bacterium]
MQLTHQLLERGWIWHDDALHAPHHTLWVAAMSDEPNLESLRQRTVLAAEEAGDHASYSAGHAALHDDLVSLIDALDDVIEQAREAAPGYTIDDSAQYLLN